MIAANPDNVEEVEVARTLLAQGQLDTAQRLLLRVCREQTELAPAFRTLGQLLQRRGDARRARVLIDYADELDAQKPLNTQKSVEIQVTLDDSLSEAKTRQVQSPSPPAGVVVKLPQKLVPPPALVSGPGTVLTLPSPAAMPSPLQPLQSSSGTHTRRAPRRWPRVFLTLFALVVVGGAAAGYWVYGRARPSRPGPRDQLDRALVSGALDGLLRARELARLALESRRPDPDVLVRLALVDAFLACDYAVDASKDAEEALKRADAILVPSTERLSLAATARALLALAAADRVSARLQADLALAATAPTPLPLALLVSARVRTLAGDATGAAADLDRALQLAPGHLPVVADWAASRIDAGDPMMASQTLMPLLGKFPDNARARLVLADAERALGEPGWTKRLDTACAGDGKISRSVRTMCAVEWALHARLDGDRAGAARKAKAIAQATEDTAALGQLSLLLALLGEVDVADEVLQKAEKSAEPTMTVLAWARLAIRLGRGETIEPLPLIEHPAGPERDLVTMRAAYARSGKQGLAAALKSLPPGVLDIDWDARALAVLGRDGVPAKPELSVLDKKADKGNPVASYVLGVLALADGDFRQAARRLDRSLALQGDGCRAATLYLDAFSRLGRGAALDKAGLRALHARNAKCSLPDL